VLEEVVFDHLHATAFQNQPLGRTILGPKENIESIQRDDLIGYIKQNYTADRMVLVGAGGVPHKQMVDLAEKHFSTLPTEPTSFSSSAPVAVQKQKPDFIGSEVRIRDDTIPTANIAIAVEGVSWKDDDYFTALVTQAIVGNWDRSMGNSPYLGSKLSTFVHENKLANQFMSFSTSYSDTGYVHRKKALPPRICLLIIRLWLNFRQTVGHLSRYREPDANRRSRSLHPPRMVTTIVQRHRGRDRTCQGPTQGVDPALP
jgi:predicted Zn-dependent peptidase